MKPIKFNSEMVRAILDGRKNQTRRPIKPQPEYKTTYQSAELGEITNDELEARELKCPFGKPGDKLWVQETWADVRGMGFDSKDSHHKMEIAYRLDCKPGSCGDETRKQYGVKYKSPITMPHWASRITLEITDIKVQRLKAIPTLSIVAEGWQPKNYISDEYQVHRDAATDWFMDMWDPLYKSKDFGWEANPWVWVIEFKTKPVQQDEPKFKGSKYLENKRGRY